MRINRPFEDCEADELHLADAIQPFGAMVVVDDAETVVAVSANGEAFLGQPPQALLGTDARRTLPDGLDLDALVGESGDLAARAGDGTAPLRPHVRTVELSGAVFTCAVHARGGFTIVELEPRVERDASLGAAAEIVQRLADRLERADGSEDAASMLLDAIAQLTGFDRAMLYRFLPGWHGEVLDERLAPGVEGFRGLRFPAGDIPANARRLYRVKRQRVIADVGAETVAVFGVREGMTLDLSGSELRAVHPVHIEYLVNMGVASSFSVSIVPEGRLWGMIACHHMAPRRLGLVTRQACELVATIAALRIANLERIGHVRALEGHRPAIERTWLELERGEAADLASVVPRLREAFGADGVLGRIGGHRFSDGDVPAAATAARLVELTATWPADEVTAGSEVAAELAGDPEAVRAASGVLHVPIDGHGHLTFLRREQVETVDWAGRPPHAEEEAPNDRPLGPRTSFALWREEARGQASPWSPAELESAERLRGVLAEQLERIELERRATTDELTGLTNRAAFEDVLEGLLHAGGGRGAALLIVDLDRFKEVNDAFGHPAGDTLLELAAERLREAVRGGDVAARMGGDEFAVFLRDVADVSALETAAERLVLALGRPYELEGRHLDVGASVGAAFARAEGETPDAWVARADRALYDAKRAGGGRYCLAEASEEDRDRLESDPSG